MIKVGYEVTLSPQAPGTLHLTGHLKESGWEFDPASEPTGLLTQSLPVKAAAGKEWKAVFSFQFYGALPPKAANKVLALEVYSPRERTVLASSLVSSGEIRATKDPQEFVLSFSNPMASSDLTFRAFILQPMPIQHLSTRIVAATTSRQEMLPAETHCHDTGQANDDKSWRVGAGVPSGTVITCGSIPPLLARGLKLSTITIYTTDNLKLNPDHVNDTAFLFSIIDRTSNFVVTQKEITVGELRPREEQVFSIRFFYSAIPGHDLGYYFIAQDSIPIEHRLTTIQSWN